MRTARILLPLLVLGGAAAGLATWQPWSGDGTIVDPSQDRAIAEAVGIRTLTEEITIRGELRRDELQTVNSAGDGRISELVIEDGDTIRAGDVLYALDGRRVVAVNGDFAFYRQLDVGSDGPDVLQLETILVEAGYPVGDVDRLFTEETRSGLAAWQADRGYGAATPEVDEVVTVSLMGNPAGYSIGAVNTVAVQIVQAHSGSAGVQGRQVAATAAGGTPTVTVSVVDVIITEGDSVTFTISADPVPTTDLEVLVSIGGDVTVDDDYESIQKTVVIAAGTATVDLVVTTLVDDDREPNEDLEVTITGLFDDVGSLAPQDLVVFDLQEEITTLLGRRDELVAEIAEAAAAPQLLRAFDLRVEIEGLLERRGELVDEIAEAQQDLAESEAEVSGLESRQREKTNVEQELIDKGIITMAQAIASDLTPAEAAQLIALDEALEEANDDLDAEDITVAAHTQAFNAYYDALEAALETSAELTTARDAVEADGDTLTRLEDEQVRLDYLLAVADADLADTEEATADTLTSLEDEQVRLDYRLDAKREELRGAQRSRYFVGDQDKATVIVDDPDVPDMPTLQIRSDSDTVRELGVASFTVETPDALVEDLDIYYEVVGTAEADSDYNLPDGDVTMRSGQETVAITIQIRSDDLVEEDESLTIRLLDDPGGEYVVSPRSEATVVVGSDDLPELTLTGGGLIAEGETAFVTVVADQAPTTDTSVNYSVSGSARAGVDFEVLMGTALLRAGEVSIEIPIRSINDDVVFQPGDMVVAEWPARVGTVSVEEGQFVMRGTPVLTLTEPVFTIKLFASPSNRAKLEVGQEVTVNLDAGDQEVAGVIVELADSVTTGGASETYEGVVDTSEALVGVDGAVVTIDVVVAQVVDAVVVPIAAVLTDGGEQKVRVVTRAGVIERRTVETGMLDGAYVEIVSGVSHGEYVILEIDRS
ncbi:MAG TPA: HlyD family efflux transporter periplasmic adaptor subunit [Acidimicrobiia bacterium]|nr:HlyD family efflux transporter periplasmic adaptor subunit [Acidimicrobiia bacterium]